MKLSIQQVVKDESSQVLFKVRLKTLAKKLGFDSLSIESMQIVASEMLSNQIKYSNKTGMVQLWFNDEQKKSQTPITIDIFAMDYGPGIKNVSQAVKDGYTTSKTMGKGLGSILRMAHESELYSLSDHKGWHGVALWGRFYLSEEEKPTRYQLGLFNRAYHDIAHNGDDVWLSMNDKEVAWLHLDGTGHGKNAELIIEKVRGIKTNIHKLNVQQMLDTTGRSLVETAGAAGVALKYNTLSGKGEYSAVGDMRMSIVQENQLHDLAVSPGILGDVSRSYSPEAINLETQAVFFSASDGIRRNWNMKDYPALWDKHPQLICFILGNQKGRRSDDQSMVALKRL